MNKLSWKKMMMMLAVVFLLSLLAACGGSEESSGTSESTETETETTSTTDEASSDDQITLSVAFFAPDNTLPARMIDYWVEQVEERTDGQVVIEKFYGGSLLQANNMYEGISNGVADIGMTLPSYEPDRFPLLEIFDISQFPNAEVATKVILDLMEEYPQEALADFKVLAHYTTEPHYVQTSSPVEKLEDLRGMQLRISGGLIPMLEKFGASPVGMSQAEVPEALQTGIIEGHVSSRDVLMDLKLAETIKYVTNYQMSLNNFTLVMDKDVWESLPENVQSVMEELIRESSIYGAQIFDEHVKESVEWSMESEGLEIIDLSDEERARWEEVSKEAIQEAVDRAVEKGLPGEEFVEKMEELTEQYANE